MASTSDAQGAPADPPVRIGVSACLLGESVRFDGGHKRDRFLTGTLAKLVAFVPVCPEVELGLPVPRETLRLVRSERGVRLVAPASGTDHTDAMRAFVERRAKELATLGLSGFVLRKDSPTCGMERVKLYDANGVPARDGRGLFAEALAAADPLLPIEEEGRLSDPPLRENFFDRVFGHRRVKALFATRWTIGDLVRFHTREKLLLLAHHTEGYRALGRVVAGAKARPRADVEREYGELYMRTLRHRATPGRHSNVLEHMLGHFEDRLDAAEKKELLGLVADHRAGLVPLVVPLTLFAHFVRKHAIAYLADQQYLNPHPKELLLRNHV